MTLPRGTFTRLTLAAILIAAIWLTLPLYMTWQLKNALHAQGFATVAVGHASVGLHGASFRDIKLDKDGNSSIALVETPVSLGWPDDIYMSGLTLSGDTGADGLPVIDGWRRQPLDFPESIRTLVIENGKFDLTTPAGGITVDFKGQMTSADRKTRQIDAVLTGNQNQLTFDMRVASAWYSNGKWQARGEIGDLRTRLDHFSASRMAGWIALHDDAQDGGRHGVPVVIDGKLTAGLMFLGPAALHDVSLVFSGPPRAFDMTMEASPGDPPTMKLNAELRHTDNTANVNALLRAKSLADIFTFLQSVRGGIDANPLIVDKPLANLMLTQGNLDRIGTQFKGQPYTAIVLSLTGLLSKVQGKVTAEIPSPTGGIARQTVDFDPAASQ